MRRKAGTDKQTADRVVKDIRRKTRKHHSAKTKSAFVQTEPLGQRMCTRSSREVQVQVTTRGGVVFSSLWKWLSNPCI